MIPQIWGWRAQLFTRFRARSRLQYAAILPAKYPFLRCLLMRSSFFHDLLSKRACGNRGVPPNNLELRPSREPQHQAASGAGMAGRPLITVLMNRTKPGSLGRSAESLPDAKPAG